MELGQGRDHCAQGHADGSFFPRPAIQPNILRIVDCRVCMYPGEENACVRCLLGYFRAEQSSMALCCLEAFGRAGLAGLDAVFRLGGILRVVE